VRRGHFSKSVGLQEMGIFRTVTYTLGISTTDIIARCKAAGLK
jgi:hypothetical protein